VVMPIHALTITESCPWRIGSGANRPDRG
jgi:hypothetical protein